MGNSSEENKSESMLSENLCVGILAHVDAGKTTLAENILFRCGSIRTMGRVDHGNTFLDNYELERARGITIFSKQAQFRLGNREITLLDTPGHADFSAEMERTLQVIDYAILVISGADGVQGHVTTLWRLLERYRIPVFLFVNKMDREETDQEELLRELRKKLHEHCIDFGRPPAEIYEELALCDEKVLEHYLETEHVTDDEIRQLIKKRRAFPCYFGSALKDSGVEELLQGIEAYAAGRKYPEEFGARVYKVSRDAQGNRLTHMKITGGCLKVKMPLAAGPISEGQRRQEKADQIRIYSGAGYRGVSEAPAGCVCAVTGLTGILPGEGLGFEQEFVEPVLEPVLRYQMILPEGCDAYEMLARLRQLEEEDPQLHLVWEEASKEIHVQVMGEIQTEILKSLIEERFGISVSFGSGSIVYKETIAEAAEGIGHFEPLRHYAEVHLLLKPGKRGSGLVFRADCSEDMLDRNWQRLIISELAGARHRGVLTGAEITDMEITVIGGRAHLKHTEGGDFRQAACRALRQGLKSTQNILLEPVFFFRLEVPEENIGRAMSDITRMNGEFSGPESEGEYAVLSGSVPAACLGDYQREVVAYTRGRGRLFCSLKGYEPCHNAEEIIEASGYDAEADTEYPTGSIFCAHGAGFYVPWDRVREYMHVDCGNPAGPKALSENDTAAGNRDRASEVSGAALDRELEEIFTRTYGAGKEERSGWGRKRMEPARRAETGKAVGPANQPKDEYLLVDGYNIIFAWEELKELAKINIESARGKLMDILCNYQGYKQNTLILVFDAYKVSGGVGSVQKYHNIYVVFTREAETADQYIEKAVHEISAGYRVTVATSDALEQMIIWGAGAFRMSAAELKEEICAVSREMREQFLNQRPDGGSGRLFDGLPEELNRHMEEVRLGKKKFGET
ncbi:MAG: TetM/TetW/TetO/TetS family tetracycline resistance ribosomal protection protein [Eubacteriales bacterium]|nr:TetM/TetW/TetO/TetS family tetracycline resistance ribosomal protection protein [Eubacteriales bacterium]